MINKKLFKICITIILILLFLIGIYFTSIYGFLAVISISFFHIINKFSLFVLVLFILLVLDLLFILHLYDIF